MLIRAAELADVSALVPLFKQWGHELTEEAVAVLLAEWRCTPRAEIVVVVVDGHVVGMAAVSAGPLFAQPGRYARLAGLVVAALYRRHGIGAALLEAAEDWARFWSCDRLELTSAWSRSAAQGFYAAHGYEETSDHHARYQRQL